MPGQQCWGRPKAAACLTCEPPSEDVTVGWALGLAPTGAPCSREHGATEQLCCQGVVNFAGKADRGGARSAQEWLWCETWCGNTTKAAARTIDLCNNPLTKEPKLTGARRIVAEWPALDAEVGAFTAQARARAPPKPYLPPNPTLLRLHAARGRPPPAVRRRPRTHVVLRLSEARVAAVRAH